MGKRKWDFEKVDLYVKENSNCILLENEYKNPKYKMRFICGTCKNEFLRDFDHFVRAVDKDCVTCVKIKTGKKKANNLNELKQYVLENTNCKLLADKYLTVHHKMSFQCGCGEEFKTSWSEFKRGVPRRCKECRNEFMRNLFKHDIEFVKNFIREHSTSKLISESYDNSEQIIEFECECGNRFYTNFDKFKFRYKRYCNSCSCQSSYEKHVENILISIGVEYIKEKRFEKCKNKNMLPFDFYLIKYNAIIEVDGEGHYRPMRSVSSFTHTLKTDSIKNEFCKKLEIPLLRIPYYELDDAQEKIIHFINKNDNTEVTKVTKNPLEP